VSFAILAARIAAYGDRPALYVRAREHTFAELAARVAFHTDELRARDVLPGSVIAIEGDFSAEAIAFLVAAGAAGHMVVPLLPRAAEAQRALLEAAEVEWLWRQSGGTLERCAARSEHPLIEGLRRDGRAGLALFTSGSTSAPKVVLHDADKLLAKYVAPGKSLRTIALLLFEHIGGLDTLFYSLFNGSVLCVPESTRPGDVCRLIAKTRAEVLPAAPSFLNLMLLAGAQRANDLSSLRIVTFGSEPISPALIARLAAELPQVKLVQKYGLSELGTLQTRSSADDPTRIKVDGRGFEARVRDGKLELKADFSFRGYLCSDEQPFTDDGWYRTGDLVDVDGDYLRIRGRERHTVNVGGEKVNPTEVEEVIAELAEVESVVVHGEAHALLGQILVATVHLHLALASRIAFEKKLVSLCRERLARHKVPSKIAYAAASLVTERMKKRMS